MTANDSKSYLGYLNNLVDEYSNTYHCSIGKKPIHVDYSALIEEIESSHKPKFEVGDRDRITKYKNIFIKDYTEIGQARYLLLILCSKLIFGHIKLKN